MYHYDLHDVFFVFLFDLGLTIFFFFFQCRYEKIYGTL